MSNPFFLEKSYVFQTAPAISAEEEEDDSSPSNSKTSPFLSVILIYLKIIVV